MLVGSPQIGPSSDLRGDAISTRRRTGLLAGLWLVVASVVACGQAPVPSTTSSSGPATAAAGGNPSPLPVSLDDPVLALAPFEHDLRAQARESAHLADLGPGAIELGAAIDASQARVLARLDEIGSIPANARLAVFRHPAAAEGVSNSLLTWAVLLSSLDDFYRDPRSGTVEDAPEQVTIGGNPATVQSTLTLNATVSGSVLIADITVRTRTQVRNAAGATLYTVDSTAQGHVEVHFCPDASGQAPVSVSLTTTETYGTAAGGSGGGSSNDYSATAVVTVNDDARIANVDGSFEGQTTSQGPPAAGSTEPGPTSTNHAGDNIANDGSGTRRSDVARNIQLAGDGTADQQVGLWAGTSLITESMILAAAREAEKLWREGKCVELQLDHGDEDVQPDAIVEITAKVHHRFDGNDLDKPVVAKLDGVKALEPTTKQPAPATVTYTAGSAENDIGRVTFNTTSNRGVAEKTIRFIVRPAAWNVTFEGTDTETFGPVANHLEATIEDLRITANGDVLSGTGDLHLTGTVTSGACSGKLNQTATVTVTGTLVGTGPESRLRVSFSTPSPAGDVVHLRCRPGGGADIAAEGHAERVGETLLGIELPADGGTLAISKSKAIGGILNVKIKGKFTVVRDES